jgi:hypothetical protein
MRIIKHMARHDIIIRDNLNFHETTVVGGG